MKKIFITGVSGVGKTAVIKEFQNRGFCAFDMDRVPGLCYWKNKQSGEKISYKGRSREWLDANAWICDITELKDFLDKRDEEIVIMAGITSNSGEYLNLFDQVFLLQIGKETLVHRINTRTEHDFGKAPAEKERILTTYKAREESLIQEGAISINAEYPSPVIVDAIVSKILYNS